MIGTTLSHYRITEKLGSGGMGEVYRAEDTNLDRQVAIKVLPDIFSGDPERLARFEREAKLLASLNHPNIAAIHGLEEAGGKRFLVLELVEGETLAQRIAKGPLPVEEALEVCRQIAEGLEAAHEKGIIHRDLKPANVKITPEGKVKVLDFGLAKALQGEMAAADASHSPTLTDQMTRPGVILGTAAYMSPEQARGKQVDKRADIWAFGCVLYECLTGKRAFEGETVTETLAAILKAEPDWHALPTTMPSKLKDLLHRCLRKDPRERLHDIADVRIEIGDSIAQPTEVVSVPQRYPFRWIVACAAVMVLASILIGAALMRYLQPAMSAPVVRSVIKVETGHWLDGMRYSMEFERPSRTAMAISSDGRFIVYSAIAENPEPQAKPQLYLRPTDQMDAKPITGSEGGINPFLSPDDRSVGFWAGGKLMKVSIEGGVPVTLSDCQALFGASWAQDNSILFSSGRATGLSRISADGGHPEALTAPDKTREEDSHRLPHCLPSGKGVLFTVMREPFDLKPQIAILDLKTRQWRVLLEDAADAQYVPTGHLIFLQRGTLMAVRFNLDKMQTIGQPRPVIAKVMQALGSVGMSRNPAAGQFSISASGSLIYAAGGILPDMENSLMWVDQDQKGTAQLVTQLKASYFAPRLSPDGQQIAYITMGSEWQVWIYDLSRGIPQRLTNEGSASGMAWTYDGKQAVFGTEFSGLGILSWQPFDKSLPLEQLATSQYHLTPGSCSPDGRTLALVESHPDTGDHISLLDLRSRRVTPLLNSRSSEMYPEFSPNGNWLAYSSDETGRNEVYVRPFPGSGANPRISSEGGTEPLWARNGKQLFYRWRSQVWVVDIHSDGFFSAGKPRLVFDETGFLAGSPNRNWDLSRDGQKFLMVKGEERKPQPVTEMILVQNWFEELKRLVPAGK